MKLENRSTLHIGIVACSSEGAALCYRTMCAEATALLGPHRHPEVSMHTHSLHRYVEALNAGKLESVADLMLESAEKLARIGADFLVCPDNTIHQAFNLVAHRSNRPWMHIAEVVADEAVERGHKKVGIIGTAWLVASDLYPRVLRERGLGYVRPNEGERLQVDRIIMDELVNGVQSPRQVQYLQQVIAHMRDAGCDAVILGCTELPLVLHDGNSPLPTLDSTRLLARAALRRAIGSLR